MSPTPEGMIDLLDWRRQVFELYQQVRLTWQDDPAKAYEHWRSRRNQLVGVHPQSPLAASARPGFAGLHHYPYNPALAFNATIETATEERFDLPVSTGGTMAFVRCGHVHLPVGTLDVYWLDTYGGGLFLPFRDATAGAETYGGGRYLLDTVKGADLGVTADGQLVLDFNFAYNPSCHYRQDWVCPLPPPANWLDARIEAGECAFPASNRAAR
jgi:uncharacterized protein